MKNKILIAKGKPSIIASKFFNDVESMMVNLYSRWLDEYKYEDINDYALPIKELAKKYDVEIIKMIKRPFGFTFSPNDTQDKRIFQYLIRGSSLEYKRIK